MLSCCNLLACHVCCILSTYYHRLYEYHQRLMCATMSVYISLNTRFMGCRDRLI
ncbi:hypothetical protein PVAP13_2KG510305 [Panicum virgatum]|uniref:Uncharacterized protein n=1 Tax=Panicum virgatum TaxID=38727 RepID=A0A8T0WMT4_PANVG|nr:hypothetical protein PVAP13_2KG510305 [Panicum virgatum]